jgi:hypothetical protein
VVGEEHGAEEKYGREKRMMWPGEEGGLAARRGTWCNRGKGEAQHQQGGGCYRGGGWSAHIMQSMGNMGVWSRGLGPENSAPFNLFKLFQKDLN